MRFLATLTIIPLVFLVFSCGGTAIIGDDDDDDNRTEIQKYIDERRTALEENPDLIAAFKGPGDLSDIINKSGPNMAPGDINLDEGIDISDVVTFINVLTERVTVERETMALGNVNQDIYFDAMDLSVLVRFMFMDLEEMPISLLSGDVNLSGDIDISDLTSMVSYVVDGDELSVQEHIAADVNLDWVVDEEDIDILTAHMYINEKSIDNLPYVNLTRFLLIDTVHE